MVNKKYIDKFRHFFDLSRKINRKHYWIFFGWFFLILVLQAIFVTIVLSIALLTDGALGIFPIGIIYVSFTFVIKFLILSLYFIFSLRRINDI